MYTLEPSSASSTTASGTSSNAALPVGGIHPIDTMPTGIAVREQASAVPVNSSFRSFFTLLTEELASLRTAAAADQALTLSKIDRLEAAVENLAAEQAKLAQRCAVTEEKLCDTHMEVVLTRSVHGDRITDLDKELVEATKRVEILEDYRVACSGGDSKYMKSLKVRGWLPSGPKADEQYKHQLLTLAELGSQFQKLAIEVAIAPEFRNKSRRPTTFKELSDLVLLYETQKKQRQGEELPPAQELINEVTDGPMSAVSCRAREYLDHIPKSLGKVIDRISVLANEQGIAKQDWTAMKICSIIPKDKAADFGIQVRVALDRDMDNAITWMITEFYALLSRAS